jgi:hypothetical protein
MELSSLVDIWLAAAAAGLQPDETGVVCVHFHRSGVTGGSPDTKPPPPKRRTVVHRPKVNECSPAFKFLLEVAQRKQTEAPALPRTTHNDPADLHATAADVPSACWHAKHIHALSRWMAKRRYRYVYSDWERWSSTQTASWSRSQHGHFRAYHNRNVRKFSCSTERLQVPVTVQRRRYVHTLQGSEMACDMACGMKQQRRIYRCGDARGATLHMSTRCGKWYRIWLEIEQTPARPLEAVADRSAIRRFFSALAAFLKDIPSSASAETPCSGANIFVQT